MRKLSLLLGIGLIAVSAIVALPTVDQTGLLVTPAFAQQPADPAPAPVQKDTDVDVTVNRTEERTVWYASPMLITIGVIVLIAIIVLAVSASRNNNPPTSTTTVVR